MPGLAVSPLKLEQRVHTDLWAGASFAVFFVASLACCIWGLSDADFSQITNIPSECQVISGDMTSSRRHLQLSAATSFILPKAASPHMRILAASSSTISDTNHWAGAVLSRLSFLILSAFLGLGAAVGWMALMRSYAKNIVYATLIIKPIILVILACVAIDLGNGVLCFIFVFCALLFAFFIWRMQSRIKLTASLIEQSIVVSKAHPSVFGASFLLLLASLLAFALFLAGGYTLILGDGHWQLEQNAFGASEAAHCFWEVPRSREIAFLIVVFFAAWASELFMMMRFFCTSLTTGIWYYSNGEGASGSDGAAERGEAMNVPLHKDNSINAPVTKALTIAWSKSFSTLCLSALIVTICEYLKRAARNRGNGNSPLILLISLCAQCVLSCIEWLTRFATTYHALTGDPFCHSARQFTSMCSKHGITTISVDFLSGMVLKFGAAIMALLIGAVTCGIVYLSMQGDLNAVDEQTKDITLLFFFFMGAFVSYLPLIFCSGVLHNIIDAAYCCLVLDLEHQAGSRHPYLAYSVFSCVSAADKEKKSNIVIQQPGSGSPVIAVATPSSAAGPTVVANSQI